MTSRPLVMISSWSSKIFTKRPCSRTCCYEIAIIILQQPRITQSHHITIFVPEPVLMTASGQLSGRLWAVSRGRRQAGVDERHRLDRPGSSTSGTASTGRGRRRPCGLPG